MATPTAPQIDRPQEIDTTPEIRFNKYGIAKRVTTYCSVNNYMRSESSYGFCADGFTESHFDEHHSIYQRNTVVPRSRLEALDANNPRSISLLTVLGADRQAVEAHLKEKGIRAHLRIL